MFQIKALCIAVTGLAATLSPAAAASSQWYETEGGRIRLIANEPRPGDVSFAGVLQVQLQPGWKTYWRDPGSSGVPPRIDISRTPGMTGVKIGFPPPHRFEDPYGSWVGYKTSTNFAITYSVDPAKPPKEINAGIFLGICKEICIPVQADLSVPLDGSMTDPGDDSLIESAFATIPRTAGQNFGAIDAKPGNGGHLVISARLPVPDKAPELFVENVGGWYFGDPQILSADKDVVRFSLAIVNAPDHWTRSAVVPYTLVSAGQSVTGEIAFEPPPK